jgi:hypothetical protein
MTRVCVQAGIGFAANDFLADEDWTDITGWVDIQSTGIGITWGAEDERSQTQTGTCTLALDNTGGIFTHAASATFLRKRTPIRVRTTVPLGVNWWQTTAIEADSGEWSERFANSPNGIGTDATHAHSGTQSMLVQWSTTGTGGIAQQGVYGLTLGRQYTASVYVWVPAGSPAVRLQVAGTLGALSTVTAAWTRITVTWTATAGSHLVEFTTGTTSPGAGTKAWLDDGQVEEGAAATTFDATAAVVSDRFYGATSSLPFSWKGLQSTVGVTCNDLFAWLSRQPALQPMLIEETLLTAPIAYYPLSEAQGATSGGDVSGYGRPALAATQVSSGGTLTFGQGTGPSTDGLSTPVFAPASATAGLVLTADMGRALDATDPGAPSFVFECWFSTTTKGRVLLAWQGNDPIAFDNSIVFLLDGTSGALVAETRDGGNLTTTTIATGNLADGLVHHLVWEDRQGVLGSGQYAMVDGIAHSLGTAVNQRFDLRRLTVGGYNSARLWAGSISHVAIYMVDVNPGIDQSHFMDHYTAGTTAFDGEPADERMGRLVSYAGIAWDSFGDFSDVAQQGQLGSNVMTHMRDVERTESGKVFCSRGAPSIVFQSRTVRYNPVPMLSLSWPDTQTDDDAWADDDQKIVNTVTGSRPGGAVQRVSDADSIATYGPYPPSGGDLTLLKMTDSEVIDAETWIVSRYADPPAELRQLVVEAYTMPAATYAALLGADISTVIGVTDLPPEVDAPSAAVVIEGCAETITQNRHLLSFHTSAANTDSVWVLDDPTYSVLGTSTRLAY